MESDKRSAQVERLEVVDTGRRRRWSEDEKLKIVLESAATARRYGVSRLLLLLRWRRLFPPEPKDACTGQMGFVPAMIVAGSGAEPGPVGSAGKRFDVDAYIDNDAPPARQLDLNSLPGRMCRRAPRWWCRRASPGGAAKRGMSAISRLFLPSC